MPLSDDQVRVIRSWVGDRPRGEDLEERYTRLGDIDEVIRETLRSQLAKLLASPSSFSTPDGLSVSTSENIRTLRETIDKFYGTEAASQEVNVTKLSRPNIR